ncbi:hypothetical protein KX928_23510 [Roseobacter sp. YSTF-M11]|uniref:Uncharacterized protein n=1 Tax=Roseobacter insulae TaxID=2859783 RepID=A0A9X1FZV8_9RHOB|nr:hypothetical protein [Roseobacter insulae]MBW4710769.1 hypothetical protein [Roseobacter insulae]
MQAKKAVLVGTLVAVPVLTPIGRPLAEEALRATLKVGERIEHVSESGFTRPRDDGTRAITQLDFGLTSETSNQRLSLSLGTGIALDFSNTSDRDTLDDPSANLTYAIENRSTVLTFDTSYRRADVGESNFFDELANENVVVDEGTRTTVSARTGLILGQDGPVTGDFDYFYLRSTFSDTIDPSRSDETVNSLNGRVTFRLSPVASAFVFANWRERDQDLATASDRTTQAIGIGGSYDISSVTSVNAQISYDEDETVSSIQSTSTDGLGYSLGLTRVVPNGSYDVNFSSTETVNGARHQATVGRSLDLKRGLLSFSVGVVDFEGASTEPLANLGLNYELTATSQFNVNLSQTPTINNDDSSTINTRLNIDYRQDLNALSYLSAGLLVASSNEVGPGAVDDSVIEASLTYGRAVGDDWDLISGISYETDRSDNRADRNTRTIFIGLEKTFDFRP